MESETSPPQLNDEQSLEDVAEDPESGDSETATEVEVSEKALKFKISTEPSLTGRKSYPGSRKGSRERVQHLNSSELARVMQKGKLRSGALSFDQHCLSSNKKLSFDAPDFLDEYAITFKKKLDADCGADDDDDEQVANECVISKETLNLNKRNSEHSVKLPEDKRSILKTSETKSYSNVDKLKMNNYKCSLDADEIEVKKEENGKAASPKSGQVQSSSVDNSSDNINSICVVSLNNQSEACTDSKHSKSLLARIKYFTDKIGLSVDKTKSATHVKNNNSSKVAIPLKNRKKLEAQCCKSMELADDRRASTLPKTKKSAALRRSWKHFIMGKEKSAHLEGWSSDVEVNKLAVSTIETDNHSLPSTSHSQSSCTLNVSPKAGGECGLGKKGVEQWGGKMQGRLMEGVVDNNVVNKVNKLQEMRADQVIIVSSSENDGTVI